MRILFVSSGNSNNGIQSKVLNQANSLVKLGHSIEIFAIKGKGFWGYLKNLKALKDFIKKNNFDIIHAHYSFSAFLSAIAGASPLVVSLMGSDVKGKNHFKFFLWLFYKFFWDITIVKSEDMKYSLGFPKIYVVPNGVNFSSFHTIKQSDCLENLKWYSKKKHILFAADPDRYEKNFQLAEKAFRNLNNRDIEMHFIKDIPNKDMPLYFNASDVVLLTSLWEGSPNVIKEAMACNCKIVSTDVGDVKWLLEGVKGCFITSFDPAEISEKIKIALNFEEKANGRDRIISLGLDSTTVANKIIKIYTFVLQNAK